MQHEGLIRLTFLVLSFSTYVLTDAVGLNCNIVFHGSVFDSDIPFSFLYECQVHLPLTPEQLKVFQDSAGLRAAANSCSRSGNGVHSEDHLKVRAGHLDIMSV